MRDAGAWAGRRLAIGAALLAVACFGSEAPVVEVGAVGSGSVTERIPAPGRVRAVARQEVVAPVAGTVARLRASDGARVRTGQTVVVLRSPEIRRAVRQARRAVERAGATAPSSPPAPAFGGSFTPPSPDIDLPDPGPAARTAAARTVEELDDEVRPALREARRQLDKIDDRQQRRAGRRTVEAVARAYRVARAAILAGGRSAAAQQQAVAAAVTGTIEEALGQLAAAQRAQSQALTAALRSQAQAAASAGQAQASAAAAAARSQAQTALTAARRQRAALTVTAPIAGTVQLGSASASGTPQPPGGLGEELDDLAGAAGLNAGSSGGSTLQPGAPVIPGQTLFTVYDLSQLIVRAEVDEIDVPRIRPGQRARVLIDAFPQTTYEGVVESVATAPQTAATGGVTYLTDVLLTAVPRDARPRVGMTASVEISAGTVQAGLTVPSRAVVRRGGGSAVYAVRDGRAELVGVQVLLLGSREAAVEGELETDDVVITSGYEELEHGQEVEVR